MTKRKSKLKIANIVMLIIIIVALFFGIKYLFFNKKDTKDPLIVDTYEKYSFVKTNNTWIFDYPGKNNMYQIPVYFTPGEVKDIPVVNLTQTDILNKETFYITLDQDLTSKSVLAGVEIGKVFGQGGVMKRTIKSAVAYDEPRVPKITCQNVTNETGVILMTMGSKTTISEDNGCIILSAGKEEDMMKLADKLIYIALGVIK